jgi:hypothetical protein
MMAKLVDGYEKVQQQQQQNLTHSRLLFDGT